MNLETAIADKIMEKVRALPNGKQEKILHFVEEVEREENSVLKQPRPEKTDAEKKAGRLALIGMYSSGNKDTAERAEEILFEEIDKRSGWTLKK